MDRAQAVVCVDGDQQAVIRATRARRRPSRLRDPAKSTCSLGGVDDPTLMPNHHASDFKIGIAADIIEAILALHLQGEVRCLLFSYTLAFG
jgi:hypothetical protein